MYDIINTEHCIGRAEGIGKETSATSVPFQAHTGWFQKLIDLKDMYIST